MKLRSLVPCVSLAAALFAGLAHAADLGLPVNPTVPAGLGVNIHFTDAKPGEMKMLADAGFTWIRMDLSWGGTERKKGEYDFSAFDRLLKSLDEHKIRALLILDYHNRFYDDGLSPHSDEGRKAMAQWAAAAVKHFQGRGVMWEMYNEPNIFFWKPKPNPPDYVKLALEVGKAIRAAAPNEIYVGPATSQIDMKFLEECFKGGLLDYWDAVTVHPYRQKAPETVAEEYAKLRRLIAQYAPKGKKIPIISGEWGYSAAWKDFDAERQGKYLPRQWLINMSQDIPISIWYDWHDDGRDEKEPEHHFGTVKNEYFKDRDPVYDPKPAYVAAKTLTTMLRGFQFNKRLAQGEQDDYCLLFAKNKDVRLTVWTVDAKKPREIVMPASPGKFQVVDYLGKKLPAIEADKNGLKVTLTDTVQYLIPEQPNELLQVAAAWGRLPSEIVQPGPDSVRLDMTLTNPLDRPIRVKGTSMKEVKPAGTATERNRHWLGRAAEVQYADSDVEIDGLARFVQTTRLWASNPLRVSVLPPTRDTLRVRVANPGGEEMLAVAYIDAGSGLKTKTDFASLHLLQKPHVETLAFPLAEPVKGRFVASVRISIPDSFGVLVLTPRQTYLAHDDFAHYSTASFAAFYQLFTDGDAKVRSMQSVSLAQPPDGPLAPGMAALKIAYDFDAGWKFIRLAPKTDELKKIEGKPAALQIWVNGDGSGNRARMRVVDSTGQVFQPDGGPIDFKGWRQVVLRLNQEDIGHWGGKNDGVIHWPIRLDTLFLLDSGSRQKTSGEIYLAAPLWVE